MNDLYNLSAKSLNAAQLRFIAHKIDLYIFKIWYITHNIDEIEQKFDKYTHTILSVNKRHNQQKSITFNNINLLREFCSFL